MSSLAEAIRAELVAMVRTLADIARRSPIRALRYEDLVFIANEMEKKTPPGSPPA